MAENNINNNELAFLEEDTNDVLHLKDITMTIARNIHWFLLCALVGAFISWFFVRRQNRVYSANAKINIQTVTNDNPIQAPTAQMSNLGSRRLLLNYSALNSELFALKSKTNMLETVDRLKLNTYYTCQTKVVKRTRDLYGESPIDVNFLDFNGTQYQTLTVTPLSDEKVKVQEGEANPIIGNYGDTLVTSATRIVVGKTWFLNDGFYDTPITVSYRNVSDVADHYRNAVSVQRNEQSDAVILISLRDPSPIRAAAVVNEVIAVYNDAAVNDKKRVIQDTYNYINDRLNSIDTELTSKESEIAAFKSSNQIIDTQNFGQEYLAGNIEASDEMESLQRQLSMARYVRSATKSGDNATLPAGVGLGNSAIDGLINQYNQSAQKLDKYEKAGNTNNPVVKNLQVEQAAQKATIESALDNYISSMESKMEDVQSYSNQMSSKLRAAPSKQVYIAGAERVQKVKEALYLNLLSKREELLISQPSIEGNAKIIDEARINKTPVAPNEKKQITTGFLLGLLIPVLIIFLLTIFDTRVRFRDDVEKIVKAPFLGEIPNNSHPDKKKNKKAKKEKKSKHAPEIVVTKSNREPIAEAFRMLRSNLEYVKASDQPSTVFMLTSLLEGSGKTFLASNMAASLALIHKKVIVVDCDLRKCTVTKQFSSTKNPGMSTYLAGKTDDIASVIARNAITEGVDALFTGPMPPNPSELLSSTRFTEIMDYLKANYEYIFLDAIPAGILADVDVIKKYADTTLFVLRSGLIDRRMLPDVERIYKSGTFPNMSVVLNDVPYAKKSHYGHYGYGYGYGYGQGYGYGYGHSYGYGYGNYDTEVEEDEKDS